MKGYLVGGFMACLAGCASVPSPVVVTLGGDAPIGRELKSHILAGFPGCGKLVPMGEQVAGRPTHVTVHGMNGAPANLQALTEQARGRGFNTLAFVYQDFRCRLHDTAADLGRELSGLAGPVRVDAHCMGARVAVRALAESSLAGQVTLNLIAPPLAGIGLANLAHLVPPFLGGLVPGTNPGYDMAPIGRYQARLESLTLPANVRTHIYYADQDHLVDYREPTLRLIERNLGARVQVIPHADHMSVLSAAARL